MSHYILFYEYCADYLERRAPLREQHLALARQAQARGELLMAGAFPEGPPGAALVFKGESPRVAELFVEDDPYVKGGVVTGWRIRPRSVVIGG